jgi:hypothetical protein
MMDDHLLAQEFKPQAAPVYLGTLGLTAQRTLTDAFKATLQ